MDRRTAQLKKIIQDESFDALTQLYGEFIEKWSKESPKRETEFETIYALGFQQGKVEGLREYFRALENIQ